MDDTEKDSDEVSEEKDKSITTGSLILEVKDESTDGKTSNFTINFEIRPKSFSDENFATTTTIDDTEIDSVSDSDSDSDSDTDSG